MFVLLTLAITIRFPPGLRGGIGPVKPSPSFMSDANKRMQQNKVTEFILALNLVEFFSSGDFQS